MKNKLKEKLLGGGTALGTFMMTSSLDTAEILSYTGVDCIMIDGEHGAMSMETAGKMVAVVRNSKAAPLLRIALNDMALAKTGMDTGAEGLMIPMINTKEEAERAVSYCKYPPDGVRGMGPGRAVLFGAPAEEVKDYYVKANDEVMVILQIEHRDAVENIDEILSVPGIDIAFVGPFDMSASMGLTGQINHPDVQESCRKVVSACKKHGVIPGIMTWSGGMDQHLEMGFKFLIAGIDGQILYNGMKRLVNEYESKI